MSLTNANKEHLHITKKYKKTSFLTHANFSPHANPKLLKRNFLQTENNEELHMSINFLRTK